MKNNYLKNVMKSVAYAASDVATSYTPSINEFKDANKEFTTATYAALRNPKQFVRKQVEAIQDSKIYKALDYGAKNLVEDLRTGNFYNKARKDRDEIGLSGLDTNWDDLSEFGIDDNWESETNSSDSKNTEVTAGDMKIVDAVEGSNAALASATVNAVVSTSDNEIKAGRTNTAMIYTQNERLFGGLHKDMTVLGNTMQQMYNLQSASLQNIDKNMSSFFSQESKLSAERNSILKEMLELQRNVYKSAADKEKEKKKGSNRIRWGDISSNGIPNLGEYFKAVKKNINNELAAVMPSGFGEDSNMLATFMTSPLEGVMKYVVEGIIPSTVKAAAKEFDGTVSGVFGNIIGALGNARSKNEGGLLGTLAKFLGVSTSVNKSIDTSKYEKGPIPFDGITRKAIIDVIPTHLRRIEAAITGRPEEMFDYKAGRWVKASDLQKQYDNIRKGAIKRATAELREAINPGAKAIRAGMLDKSNQKSWDLALEEFEEYLYNNNGRFNPNASASENGIDSVSYKNLYTHYSKIRTLFRNFDKIESKDRNGKVVTRNTMNRVRMQLSNAVLDARENEEKQYRDIETDVGNVLASFFGAPKHDAHGKYKTDGKFQAYNNLNNTKDNLGNTIFDYLQNINKELTWMRLNGGVPGGGGYGKRKKGKYKEAVEFGKIDITNPGKPKDDQYTKDRAENERIEKAALEAIKSGKAIDLRDFDVDEQAYLLQLSDMLKNNAVSEYAEEIKGYNTGNAITGFLDKHFIKTNIKNLKDVEKAIEKAEKEGKNTNEVNMDAKEETFFRKIMNRIGQGESILGGVVGASSEAFTNLLYTADKAIYEMMYKTEIDSDVNKEKYNGFMDMIVHKTSDTFKTIKDKLKSDLIDPFLERFGLTDKFGDFKGRFKESLINSGSRLWTAFKDANTSVYGPAWHQIQVELGMREGETLAQKQRASNRVDLKKDYDDISEMKRLIDIAPYLLKYKLDPMDYKSVDEARNALKIKFEEEIYNNSKNATELTEDELDLAKGAISRDPKKLDRVIKTYGLSPDGATEDEVRENVFKLLDIHKGKLTDSQQQKFVAIKHNPNSQYHDNKKLIGKDLGYGDLSYEKALELLDKLEKVHHHKVDRKKLKNTNDVYNAIAEVVTYRVTDDIAIDNEIDDYYDDNFTSIHTQAKGTTGKPFYGLTTLTKGEGLIGGNGSFGVVPKTGVYNVTSPTHIVNTEQMHDLGLGSGPRVSVQSAYGKEKLAAEKAGFSIAHNDAGTMNITDKNGDKLGAKGVFEEAKKFIPEAAAGGLVGGILSLVLGLAGGPLLGAAVGAGGSIIAGSDKLKQKLFGKAGEDGKNDGSGIISKTIMDKFHKYFPDMAKYGLAGLIPGLLTPLGPIGGLMAGAAFGFLKNNEKFTNKYFGEKGKLTIGSKEKKILQDMLPGALKGAGIGAVASLFLPTPFGIVGNAVIGAGLGMMASTEEFKNSILGREVNGERIGGLVNTIKDSFAPLKDSMVDLGKKLIGIFDKNIVDPIARFVTPAIHALPQLFSLLPRKINEWFQNLPFKKTIDGFIKDKIMTPLSGIVKKVVSPVVKGVANVVTAPVRLLGAAGDKIREKQIKTGNADYMTARERIDFMIKKGKAKQILESDKVLADIGTKGGLSVEDAEKQVSNLQTMFDTKDSLYASRRRQEKKINSILDGYKTADGKQLSPKTKKLLRQAMEAGDINKVRGILQSSALQGSDTGLSEAQIKTLMDGETGLGNEIKRYMGITDREKAIEGLTKEDQENRKANISDETLKKLGITRKQLNDRHFMNKFMANMQTEILDRKANETGKDEVALETENNKTFKSMNTHLEFIANAMLAIATGDDKSIKKLSKQHDKEYNEAMGNLESDYNERKREAGNIIGGKKYQKLRKNVRDKFTADTFSHVFGIESRNKNLEMINDLSPNEINACNGDVERLYKIKKLGYKVLIKDIPSINEYGESDFKILYKFLEYKFTKEIYGKKRLKKSDMDLMINTDLSEFKKRCKFVFKQSKFNPKDFTIEKVMSFQGDRAGEGLKPITDKPTIANNSWGTILSSALGIGKSVVGGIGKVASGIGKGAKAVGNLFKGGKEGSSQSPGILGSLGGIMSHINPFNNINIVSSGNTDETDKAKDGTDVHMTSEGPVKTELTSDGSVEYDTSDSQTKDVLNKLSLKEKMAKKVQEAQLKATELLQKTFDTSEIPESRGGKVGLLGLLASGILLWKTGILKKLFDGFVKPVWTEHIKPWIDEKAVPWIEGMWNDRVKPFLTDTVAPWVTNTVLPELGSLFGAAIASINWGNVIGGFFDGMTGGNKNNAGGKTKVKIDTKSKDYDPNRLTGMVDENGKQLTYGDIASGNYKEIYNIEGVKGVVNKDGSVTFNDPSKRGSSAVETVANAGVHNFAKSMASGKSSTIVTAAKNASSKLAKSNSLLGKVVGKGGEVITKAVDAAGNLGVKARGFTDKLVNKQGASMIKNIKASGFEGGSKEIYEQFLKNGDGSKASKVVKAVAGTDNVVKTTAKVADTAVDAASGAAKNKGLLAKLAARLKDAIGRLFKNEKVVSMLTKLGTSLGKTNVGKWLVGIKESIEKVFKEALEKGITKAGASAAKNVLGKALWWVMLITDFLAGCDRAESILGVTETTIIEEVIAGLINALCNLLIIPAIFPGVPWIAKFLFKIFGKDLEERQKQADAEYEKYKEETGSTLTKEEYLAEQYSVTGKVGGAIKKGLGKAGKAIKSGAAKVGDAVKTAASATGKIIKKAGGFVKEGAVKVIDFAKELGGKVLKGDIKGLISYKAAGEDKEGILATAQNMAGHMAKIPLIIPTIISAGVHKIASFVGKIITKVKDVGSGVITFGKQIGKYVLAGDVLGLMGFNSGVEDTEDYAGNLSKPVVGAMKLLTFIPTVISAGVHKVADIVGKVIDGVKTIGVSTGKTLWSMKDYVIKGDLKGLYSYKPTETEGLAGGTAKVVSGIGKVIMTAPAVVSLGIHKAADGITAVVDGVKTIGVSTGKTLWDMKDYMIKGDLTGLYSYKPTETEGLSGGTAKVVSGIGKVILTAPTVVSLGIHKAAEGIGKIVDGVKTIGVSTGKTLWDMKDYMIKGDLTGLYSYSPENSEGLAGGTAKVVSGIGKVILTAPTVVSLGIHKVVDGVTTIIDEIKTVNVDTDAIIKQAKSGDISLFSKDYWKVEDTESTGFVGALGKVSGFITRAINAPFVLVSNIFNKVADAFSNIKKWVEEKFKGVKEFFEDPLAFVYKKITGKETIEGEGTFEKVDKSGKGSYGRGKYSKQIDPAVSNIRFNSNSDSEYQTIGDSGCGPAAAVNALESMYGRGNKVASAAKFALKRGYKETNGGTEPGFFGDYFNANGYRSQTTSNKSQLEQNIRNGVPTVIMGKDPKGVSSSSPFGSNPHYVTITGVDGRGNAIVQDPESKYDNQLYPIDSLMKQTSFGSSVFGRGAWGKGAYDSNIWWYLKEMGMTDAGAAGMMGNLAAESGLHPDRLQGDVPYSQKSVDYTAKVDNGSVSEHDFVHNGPGGGGYGLAQWTYYTRKQGLYNLTKSRNTSIADIGTQLQWLGTELNGYSSVMNTLTSTDNIKTASDIVLTQFERPADQGETAKNTRKNLGQGYLDKYKGTKGTEISGSIAPGKSTFTGTDDTTSGTTDSTTSSTDLFGYISSGLDNILGDKFTNITNKLSEIGDMTKYLKGFNISTGVSQGESQGESNTTSGSNLYSSITYGLPVDAPYKINAYYKQQGSLWSRGYHTGIDFDDYSGLKIYSTCDGEVTKVTCQKDSSGNITGYGYYIQIKDANGNTHTYAHLVANSALVSKGNKVSRGTHIATMGTTGHSTGVHLHYDIRDSKGDYADPSKFLGITNATGVYNVSATSGTGSRRAKFGKGNINGYKPLSKYGRYASVSLPTYDKSTTDSKQAPEASQFALTSNSLSNFGKGNKNGSKPLSKYGQFKNSIYGNGTKRENTSYSANNNSLKQTSKNTTIYKSENNDLINHLFGMPINNSIDYTKLINSIIAILMTIADNTDKLNTIVSILNNKLNLNISASDVSDATSGKQTLKSKLATALNGINNSSTTNPQDNSINAIITAMNAIASE